MKTCQRQAFQLEIVRPIRHATRLEVERVWQGNGFAQGDRRERSVSTVAVTVLLLAVWATPVAANQRDALAARASWHAPDAATVFQQVSSSIEQRDLSADQRQTLDRIWQDHGGNSPAALQAKLVETVRLLDERAAELIRFCERPREASELPEFFLFRQPGDLPPWGVHALQLHYGCWLANQQLYDEAYEQLDELQWQDVADPASLLFYRSLVLHRRLEKDQCLATLRKLLENEDNLPRRYAAVAKLMQADLKPLKTDSLDEISRLMDNIKIRLGHGRAGQRVQKEEEAVVAKLDKLIEQLEQQAQQAAAASSGSNGSQQPTTPMEDSVPAGARGPGNVDPKKLGTETDWGNLPPKQREAALQQLSKDLPSHYRSVIEDYFRKLAKEDQ